MFLYAERSVPISCLKWKHFTNTHFRQGLDECYSFGSILRKNFYHSARKAAQRSTSPSSQLEIHIDTSLRPDHWTGNPDFCCSGFVSQDSVHGLYRPYECFCRYFCLQVPKLPMNPSTVSKDLNQSLLLAASGERSKPLVLASLAGWYGRGIRTG